MKAMIFWPSPLASLANLFTIASGHPGDPPAIGKNTFVSGKCADIKNLLI